MKNKTFTRLLCLALALMCLVSSAGIVVSAQEKTVKHDNLTDKTISDYKDTLDLISYADYQSLYYSHAAKAS